MTNEEITAIKKAIGENTGLVLVEKEDQWVLSNKNGISVPILLTQWFRDSQGQLKAITFSYALTPTISSIAQTDYNISWKGLNINLPGGF